MKTLLNWLRGKKTFFTGAGFIFAGLGLIMPSFVRLISGQIELIQFFIESKEGFASIGTGCGFVFAANHPKNVTEKK